MGQINWKRNCLRVERLQFAVLGRGGHSLQDCLKFYFWFVNLPKGPLFILVWLRNHSCICSWNPPVLSNEGKASCSRNQQEPLMGFEHKTGLITDTLLTTPRPPPTHYATPSPDSLCTMPRPPPTHYAQRHALPWLTTHNATPYPQCCLLRTAEYWCWLPMTRDKLTANCCTMEIIITYIFLYANIAIVYFRRCLSTVTYWTLIGCIVTAYTTWHRCMA